MNSREFDTDRLSLRVPTLADYEDSAAMWGDAAVVRHVGGQVRSREDSWLRFLRHVGQWQLFDFGFWIVREKANGGFVGEVGFGEFRRDITPSFAGDPEMGWVLAHAAHGKGYATEAARAALVWMEHRHHPPRTVCIIDPENTASLRVAAKCGFQEFGRTSYKNATVALFERLAA